MTLGVNKKRIGERERERDRGSFEDSFSITLGRGLMRGEGCECVTSEGNRRARGFEFRLFRFSCLRGEIFIPSLYLFRSRGTNKRERERDRGSFEDSFSITLGRGLMRGEVCGVRGGNK